jgi:hypothetical protein
MGDYVQNEVGVTGDDEIEAPVAIHAGLPDVAGLIVLLGAERRVTEVLHQQFSLFIKRLLNDGRSGYAVLYQRRPSVGASSGIGFNSSGLSSSGFLDLAVEKSGHLFVGFKGPGCLAFLRLLQRLGEAGIDELALGRRVFAAGGAVNNKLGGENNLTPLRFGFQQVAVSQAHLGTEADGDGHLALALYLNDGPHSDQFP